MRQPVEFLRAATALIESGARTFLEIGPHPVLAAAIRETLTHAGATGACLSSLRRGQPEPATILRTLGELHVSGHVLDWSGLCGQDRLLRRLPTYRWQHEQLWHEPPASKARRTGARIHPIIARVVDSPVPTWEADLDSPALAYLEDHKIQGAVVFPGAGYVEMACAAARELFGGMANIAFHDLEFRRILFLNADEPVCLRIQLDPKDGRFTISSRKYDALNAWETHTTGRLLVRKNNLAATTDLAAIKARCGTRIPRELCYEHFRSFGLEYGPTFQGIQELWQGDDEALARIQVPSALVDSLGDHLIHPVLTDYCFQTLAAALPIGDGASGESVYIPVGVREGWVIAPAEPEVWIHARITSRDGEGLEGDIRLILGDGRVAVAIDRCLAKSLKSGGAFNVKPQSLYRLEWDAQPLAPIAAEPPPGAWLILANDDERAQGLARTLARRNQTSYVARPGAGFAARDSGFEFDPGDPNGIAVLIEHVTRQEHPPLRGVIHMLAVDCALSPDASRGEIDRANRDGSVALLHTLQALVRQEWAAPPRIWVVTEHAQPVVDGDGTSLNVFQSPLWGMAKVAGQIEHRDLWGAIVDVDADNWDATADRLADEIFARSGEDQVAFRQGGRYVPRLRTCREVALPTLPAFRPDVSYLITGGLGALGVVMAHWIVERGGRHLILTSRGGVPPRERWADLDPASADAQRVAAVRKLESAGAHVRVLAADVTEESELAEVVIRNRREGYPPIRGVIHSAGTALPKLLIKMDAAELARVLRPKVEGARNLHKAFAGEPLDFFTLFSSVASVVVSAGQGNYSAGNAFLDALAHWRRAHNQAGLSVNWGPWGEVGMATQLDLIAYFQDRGFFPMTTAQGLEAMGQLCGERTAQAVVLAADWKLVADVAFLGAPPAMLAEVIAASADDAAAGAQAEGGEGGVLLRYSAEPDAAARRRLLEDHLADLASRVLRIDKAKLRAADSLNARGMDSMMAIELKNRIETSTGVNIAIVELLRGASIADVADRLSVELEKQVEIVLDREVAAILREAETLADNDLVALMMTETDAAPAAPAN